MNTYVVIRSRYGKDSETLHKDRIRAQYMEIDHRDPQVIVTFYGDQNQVLGYVSDFDSVYLESAVEFTAVVESETD